MKRFTFYHWLIISLALHVGVVAFFVIATKAHIPHQVAHSRLRMDIVGMVSDRQVQERIGGNSAPPGPKAQPVKQAKKEPSPEKDRKDKAAEEKAPDAPGRTTEAAGPADAHAPTVAGGGPGQGPSQRGQSIAHPDQGTDKTTLYIRRLAKRIQANLIYPEELRKSGIEGISTIAFTITESGVLKTDSLKVQKTSGYPALDANALKSASRSAPFEKPHKELTVTIAVAFTIDMLRSRVARGAQ